MATDYKAMVRAAAKKHGIDPNLFERQIGKESSYAEDVITGKRRSSAGATGIAQLMPAHWKNVDPLDPVASLDYAARLMSSHLKNYDNDWRLALAAYNAGPGNVAKYKGIPPFEETQNYINAIMNPTPSGDGGTGMPEEEPTGQEMTLEQWIRYLEAKIKELEAVAGQTEVIRGQTVPTAAAFTANEQLPKLRTELSSVVKANKSDTLKSPAMITFEDKRGSKYATQPLPPGVEGPWPTQKFFEGEPKLEDYQDPMTGAIYERDAVTKEIGKMVSGPIPGWIPGFGVQAPKQQTLEDRAKAQQDLQKGWLDIQKTQQDLMSPYTLWQQRHGELIEELERQQAKGQITPAEANRLMGLSKQSLQSSMMGTTPWEMQNTRANQTGVMARGLLQSLIDAKLNTLTGPIDPLEIARAYMAKLYNDELPQPKVPPPAPGLAAQGLLEGAYGAGGAFGSNSAFGGR